MPDNRDDRARQRAKSKSWFETGLEKGGVWFVLGLMVLCFLPLVWSVYQREQETKARHADFMARCVADRGQAKSYECETLFAISKRWGGRKADPAVLDTVITTTDGVTR